jgi:hypothetical protein
MSFRRVPERSVRTPEALAEKLKKLGATEGVVWNADVTGGGPTFFSQLHHMKEAEHLLELADRGGHFDDLYTTATTEQGMTVMDLNNALIARAEEILADEYPDVQVRVRASFAGRPTSTRAGLRGLEALPRSTHFVCVGRGVNASFPSPKNEEVARKLEALCQRSSTTK